MKILLIQPPKYFWPYISADDNFLVSQWMPCLGAIARDAGFDVRLIDCAPQKLGWKSLAREIERERPDIVGVGENHAVFSHESIRALRLAKELRPEIVTIAGGSHFTNLIEESLASEFIDFIVCREGEETFVELLKKIKVGGGYETVRGIAYRGGGELRVNPPRPLIDDLDSLPMPAYDLMPMRLYGTSRFLFSPGGATIHHSRGCVSNCRFCAWWRQMADAEQAADGRTVLKPRWRTKSVARTIDEIRLLATEYNKRCLVFVDEYWNKDPDWSAEFADALIAEKLGVEWFAFMRADTVIRDEKLGVLEKLVRSGLVHVSIGVERVERDELKNMGKGFYSENTTIECFKILRDRYPGVFRQGTFIVGVRHETPESMIAQADFARRLDLDYPGFHPITPVPGTAFWEEAKAAGWIETFDYTEYDWMTPIISSEHMTRSQIDELLISLSRRFVSAGWFLRGVTSRSRYKRNMYLWWLIVTMRVVWSSARRFAWPFKTEVYAGLVKPDWYDD